MMGGLSGQLHAQGLEEKNVEVAHPTLGTVHNQC